MSGTTTLADIGGFLTDASETAGDFLNQGGGSVGAAAAAATVAFIGRSAIGPIIPQVVVEEGGFDELYITEHPVEHGAPITDHVFKRPVEVRLQVGWAPNGFEGLPQLAYSALLALQWSGLPFVLVTARRLYGNMVIQSLAQTRDAKFAHAMLVDVVCRQVIIATATSTTLPPAAQQANPQQTAEPLNNGVKQVTPAAPQSSVLNSLANGVRSLF